MFSYVSPEARIPADHPLRATREMTNRALARLDRRFRKLYSRTGRPSVAPEQLLRALLLQVLYSIRSERMLMEQLEYNLLFRWFVGLEMDDRVWDVTVFTKNRNRLLEGEIAESFFQAVARRPIESEATWSTCSQKPIRWHEKAVTWPDHPPLRDDSPSGDLIPEVVPNPPQRSRFRCAVHSHFAPPPQGAKGPRAARGWKWSDPRF